MVLDPEMGKMFWADVGESPKIEMSWMDGSKRKPLVTSRLHHPTGLTVDTAMDHALYWVDTKLNVIESIKYDQKNRVVVIRGGEFQYYCKAFFYFYFVDYHILEHLHHPVSLDLFENQLYWLSRETGELIKQDKFGRGVPVIIAKDLVNPTGVKG